MQIVDKNGWIWDVSDVEKNKKDTLLISNKALHVIAPDYNLRSYRPSMFSSTEYHFNWHRIGGSI